MQTCPSGCKIVLFSGVISVLVKLLCFRCIINVFPSAFWTLTKIQTWPWRNSPNCLCLKVSELGPTVQIWYSKMVVMKFYLLSAYISTRKKYLVKDSILQLKFVIWRRTNQIILPYTACKTLEMNWQKLQCNIRQNNKEIQ